MPLVRLILIALIAALGPHVCAQSAGSGDSQSYRRAFENCYTLAGRAIRPRLLQFEKDVSDTLARGTRTGTAASRAHLISLLASAQLELGDGRAAEHSLRELSEAPTALQEPESAIRRDLWVEEHLVAAYALERDWPRAATTYARWCLRPMVLEPLGYSFACLVLAALWQYGIKRGTERPDATIRRHIGILCLVPLLVKLFDSVALPLNSALITGNPGSYIAARYAYTTVLLCRLMEASLLLMTICLFVSRREATAQQVAANVGAGPACPADGRRRVLCRTGWTLAVVAAGLILESVLGQVDWRAPALLFERHMYIGGPPLFSPSSLHDVLGTFLGPLTEEMFFRGLVYRHARQTGGVAFGAAFSALVFTGCHYWAVHPTGILWAGIVFALQYEVLGSIRASVATHSISNGLYYLGTLVRSAP